MVAARGRPVKARDLWATGLAMLLFLVGAASGGIVLSALLAVAAFGAVELTYPVVRAQLEPLLAAADNRRALLESRQLLERIGDQCQQVPATQAGRDQLVR